MSDNPREEREWEAGWDGHSEAQQRRLAALPLYEKIRWLEEAQKLAEQIARSRKQAEREREEGR